MRISPQQIATIVQTTRSIDLLIESTPVAGLMDRARIKTRLEQELQLPVDVLATRPGAQDSPFVAIARAHAVRLSL